MKGVKKMILIKEQELHDLIGYIHNLLDFIDVEDLENIENKIKYKRWFFGHFHEDIELDKKATLLFYNITKII